MVPVFESRDVHQEALAALLLFRQAADAEEVTLGCSNGSRTISNSRGGTRSCVFARRSKTSEDDGLEGQDEALRRKMGVPERRWRLKLKDGASGSKMTGRETKMAARKER